MTTDDRKADTLADELKQSDFFEFDTVYYRDLAKFILNRESNLKNRIESLEAALRTIVSVLGPEAADHGCIGCQVEMGQALGIAKQALKPEQEGKGGGNG